MGQYQSTCGKDNCGRALVGTANGLSQYFSRAADCTSYLGTVTVYPSATVTTVTSGSVSSTITPTGPVATTITGPTGSTLPAWVYTACTPTASAASRFTSACSCATYSRDTTTAATPVTTIIVPTTPAPTD